MNRQLRSTEARVHEAVASLLDSGATPAQIIAAASVARVPVSIFVPELGPLEALVMHLHERGMRQAEIARHLHRDPRVIGVTLRRARIKRSTPLPTHTNVTVALVRLTDPHRTVFEHLVRHLVEERGMPQAQVARLLQRDPTTVWTVLARTSRREKKRQV